MASSILVLASILSLWAFTSATLSSDNVLFSTNILAKGKRLAYKDYALTLQNDCNLVLSGPRGAILWQTNTAYIFVDCALHLTSHGELVLNINSAILPVFAWSWSSGVKSEKGEYALVLNYDGSLKIYGKSIWSSSNHILDDYKDSKDPLKSIIIPVTDSTLWSGDIAPIGTIIVKDDFKLELGMTCNLTLTDTKTKRVLWHTNTTDITRDCFVNLEGNGELLIKYLGGATLWGNKAGLNWGAEYVLVLRPQGLLTVYGPVIWSSKKSFDGEANIAMVTAQ